MRRALALFGLSLLLLHPLAWAGDDDEDNSEDESSPAAEVTQAAQNFFITPHRYAFVAAGGLVVVGASFGYWGMAQSQRARDSEGANDARLLAQSAQQNAQLANMMYALAGISVLYGLVMEILPEPVAQKASLTFHF